MSSNPRRQGRKLTLLIVVSLLLSACGEPGGLQTEPTASRSPGASSATSPRSIPPAPPSSLTTTTTAAIASPEVTYDGSEYVCERTEDDEWNCKNQLNSVIYCNGSSEPTDCSARWYPDDLAAVDLVEFEGVSYACERFGNRCVAYDTGPPPTAFFAADIWCDLGRCSHYDPDDWFELQNGATSYFCQETPVGFQKYDCEIGLGDRPPVFIAQPDLYCSGNEAYPDCSDLWYPSDLVGETIINYGDSSYLCDRAITGEFGDYDCGAYSGGDPALVSTGALKCSEIGGGFDCSRDEYPSALEGVYFVTIGYTKHVCEDTYMGSECWAYFAGSVRNAMFGPPDYYCNHAGSCERFGYP